MSLFDEMENVTLKRQKPESDYYETEGISFFDEALNIKQMLKDYRDKKEAKAREKEENERETKNLSNFTYGMEQKLGEEKINGAEIVKAISEYETGNKHFAIVRLSYAVNFLAIARGEDEARAKSLVKAEVRRAKKLGIEGREINRELRSCKSAAKHSKFIEDLISNMHSLRESTMELELPGDGVKETTSEKQYRKVPMKQENDLEPVNAKEIKLEIPGDGVKETTSGQDVYAKVPEKQEVDMESKLEESFDNLIEDIDDIDDLIEEAMELLPFSESCAERRVKKAERKLEVAKTTKKELDKAVAKSAVNARSIAKGKARADEKIERAERKLRKAKTKAGMSEAVELSLPGDGVKETTSGKDVYAKLANQQMVDAPEPKKDQAPEALIKVGKVDPKEVEEMVDDFDVEDEIMDESTVIEYFDEIKLSESQVRVFSQYGKFIISESDFEACCAYYDGESEETVLNAIAEANNIDVNDIHIMLAEGRCAAKKKVKKAMNKKGSSDVESQRKRTEAKIRRLKDQLKDTAPSSATAKKLQAQIKKLKATLK